MVEPWLGIAVIAAAAFLQLPLAAAIVYLLTRLPAGDPQAIVDQTAQPSATDGGVVDPADDEVVCRHCRRRNHKRYEYCQYCVASLPPAHRAGEPLDT